MSECGAKKMVDTLTGVNQKYITLLDSPGVKVQILARVVLIFIQKTLIVLQIFYYAN